VTCSWLSFCVEFLQDSTIYGRYFRPQIPTTQGFNQATSCRAARHSTHVGLGRYKMWNWGRPTHGLVLSISNWYCGIFHTSSTIKHHNTMAENFQQKNERFHFYCKQWKSTIILSCQPNRHFYIITFSGLPFPAILSSPNELA